MCTSEAFVSHMHSRGGDISLSVSDSWAPPILWSFWRVNGLGMLGHPLKCQEQSIAYHTCHYYKERNAISDCLFGVLNTAYSILENIASTHILEDITLLDLSGSQSKQELCSKQPCHQGHMTRKTSLWRGICDGKECCVLFMVIPEQRIAIWSPRFPKHSHAICSRQSFII